MSSPSVKLEVPAATATALSKGDRVLITLSDDPMWTAESIAYASGVLRSQFPGVDFMLLVCVSGVLVERAEQPPKEKS